MLAPLDPFAAPSSENQPQTATALQLDHAAAAIRMQQGQPAAAAAITRVPETQTGEVDLTDSPSQAEAASQPAAKRGRKKAAGMFHA